MPLRLRWRPRLGPLRFNVTGRGLRSVSMKVGPFTWNPTRGRLWTNLPGPLYYTGSVPEAAPRPTACRCACAATAHSEQGCTRCPCRKYRRAR